MFDGHLLAVAPGAGIAIVKERRPGSIQLEEYASHRSPAKTASQENYRATGRLTKSLSAARKPHLGIGKRAAQLVVRVCPVTTVPCDHDRFGEVEGVGRQS